jgi:pimeloyl-ACP methyl ester carboxylesterase
LEYAATGVGEPVVCIRGAFVADTFQPLLTQPRLTSRYWLLTYHRRGYVGSSRISGPTSVAQQAADCRALLAHLEVEQAHVVDHSFGSAIALQLALDTAELVHLLALIEPASMIDASGGPHRVAPAQAGSAIERWASPWWTSSCRRSPGYRERLDRWVPGAVEQAVADAATWFETELPAQLTRHFDTAEARQITQPVLSILGEESDALWDRFGKTHRWMLGWFPHAEGCVLPDATHVPQIEHPSALAGALAAFFERHSLDPVR